MIKKNLYRYLGRNGMITSEVLLEGINHIAMYYLKASEGHALTNGEKIVQHTSIFAEDLENWKEIIDPYKDELNK